MNDNLLKKFFCVISPIIYYLLLLFFNEMKIFYIYELSTFNIILISMIVITTIFTVHDIKKNDDKK